MSPDEDEDLPLRDEDEVSIPRASLNKFIKDIVPEARLTTETRELILACCHAFIHKLATEANIACAKANKKTISPQHILEGLDAMNLSTYKENAELACQEAKEELKGRRMLSASYRFKHQDNEELERLTKEQQQIFEQARAGFVGEQLGRGDLLVASNHAAAASTLEYQSNVHNSIHLGNPSNSNNFNPDALHPDSNPTPLYKLPTATGSARILGSFTVDDDDNYDD